MEMYCVKCRVKHKIAGDEIHEERRKTKGKTTVFAVAKCPVHGIELWKILRRE